MCSDRENVEGVFGSLFDVTSRHTWRRLAGSAAPSEKQFDRLDAEAIVDDARAKVFRNGDAIPWVREEAVLARVLPSLDLSWTAAPAPLPLARVVELVKPVLQFDRHVAGLPTWAADAERSIFFEGRGRALLARCDRELGGFSTLLGAIDIALGDLFEGVQHFFRLGGGLVAEDDGYGWVLRRPDYWRGAQMPIVAPSLGPLKASLIAADDPFDGILGAWRAERDAVLGDPAVAFSEKHRRFPLRAFLLAEDLPARFTRDEGNGPRPGPITLPLQVRDAELQASVIAFVRRENERGRIPPKAEIAAHLLASFGITGRRAAEVIKAAKLESAGRRAGLQWRQAGGATGPRKRVLGRGPAQRG